MQNGKSSATYFRPDKLEESLHLLAGQPLRVVAGATDVYPARVAQRAWAQPVEESWLDITAIESLKGISRTAFGWKLGSLVTWSELVQEDLPACFDCLKAAAVEVGGMQIQNRATIAGNLCNASPAADGVPPLLCLDALVELASEKGNRVLPVHEFILGNRSTARRHDELLTAIVIPDLPAASRDDSQDGFLDELVDSRFFKLGARKYLVISIVMAAGIVSWDKQRNLRDCRFAVGSCSPVAMRLPELENELAGLNLDDIARGKIKLQELIGDHHVSALTPIDDVRADAGYRREAARSCLLELLEMHTRYCVASKAMLNNHPGNQV